MEKLKPCPFCGQQLEYEEHIAIKVAGYPLLRLWAHPSGSCILAGLEVPKEDHEAWNRRANIPASEEVYDKYTDTAGNLHWTGTYSGEHTIKAEEGE